MLTLLMLHNSRTIFMGKPKMLVSIVCLEVRRRGGFRKTDTVKSEQSVPRNSKREINVFVMWNRRTMCVHTFTCLYTFNSLVQGMKPALGAKRAPNTKCVVLFVTRFSLFSMFLTSLAFISDDSFQQYDKGGT